MTAGTLGGMVRASLVALALLALSVPAQTSKGPSLPASPLDWTLGGLTAILLYFWRESNKEKNAQKAIDDKRYDEMAANYRAIIQENTRALTSLVNTLNSRPCVKPDETADAPRK